MTHEVTTIERLVNTSHIAGSEALICAGTSARSSSASRQIWRVPTDSSAAVAELSRLSVMGTLSVIRVCRPRARYQAERFRCSDRLRFGEVRRDCGQARLIACS